MLKLIQRFYQFQNGTVKISGDKIEDLNLKYLRNQIGEVSQEPILFDATVEENIKLGKPDATLEEGNVSQKFSSKHDFLEIHDIFNMLYYQKSTKSGKIGKCVQFYSRPFRWF